MTIWIVRHADPDYAHDSLTEKGWCEAECLKERLCALNADYYYCSPAGRAQDTAKPTMEALGKSYEVFPWLREFDGLIRRADRDGAMGLCWDLWPSVLAENPALFDKNAWLSCPLMQDGDVKGKYEAVCEGLDALLEKHGYRHDGHIFRAEKANTDTIVLFCHFGVECVLLSHLLNVSPVVLWQGFVALPSSVTILHTEERQQGIAYWRASAFGDLSHLEKKGEEPSFAARFCETFDSPERH